MDLIINNGISAISLPLDEDASNGVLVQSVDWSCRSDVVEYKNAAKHGAVVARQDRNQIMSMSLSAYMLSTNGTALQTFQIGTGSSDIPTNLNYATSVSPFFDFTTGQQVAVLDGGSVSADGQSNPKVDLTYKIYPYMLPLQPDGDFPMKPNEDTGQGPHLAF